MDINVNVIKTYLEIIACHVLHQEYGIYRKTIVFAQPLKQFGLEVTVNALQVFMVTTVFLVQLQDIGILIKNNVFAEIH